MSKLIVGFTTSLLLCACGTFEKQDGPPLVIPNLNAVANATPRYEPLSKYGNPSSYVVRGIQYKVLKVSKGYSKRGIASWYGKKFHGRRTSSGETYNMFAMTAAHKSLPLPAFARITNLRNNRSIVVKINDRGPFHANRIIDLSYIAAAKLDILKSGTGLVEVTVIDPLESHPKPNPVAYIESRSHSKPINTLAKPSQLFLQVGAFSKASNAQQLVSRLLASDLNNIHIKQSGNSPNKIFRVRIGPLPTIKQSDKLFQQLAARGFKEHHVVIE